jgi:hypothetical protein
VPVKNASRRIGLWRTKRLGASVLVVLSMTAGGCVPDSGDPPDPVLVWPDGEPDGPLEENEWVRAARAAEVAYSRAVNAADFSQGAIVDTWDEYAVRRVASRLEGQMSRGNASVHLGPAPLLPVAVDVAEDGKSALVAACVDAYQRMPSTDDGNVWPNVRLYEIELGADGRRRYSGGGGDGAPYYFADGSELTPEYCADKSIPRAIFDPAPDLAAFGEKWGEGAHVPTP